LKISTQWNLIGISTALLTFISLFIFIYYGPIQSINSLLVSFGNPFLMVFYLLFAFVSFRYAYLESKKEQPDYNEDNEKIEVVFINRILGK
jgi:hypothetical protein